MSFEALHAAHWRVIADFASPACVLPSESSARSLLRSRQDSLSRDVNMKRERLTQIVLVIVGLVNLAIIYPLFMDLWHSSWQSPARFIV